MRNNSDICAAPSAKNTHKGLDIFKLPPHPLPREQNFRPFCFESEASVVAFMFISNRPLTLKGAGPSRVKA